LILAPLAETQLRAGLMASGRLAAAVDPATDRRELRRGVVLFFLWPIWRDWRRRRPAPPLPEGVRHATQRVHRGDAGCRAGAPRLADSYPIARCA